MSATAPYEPYCLAEGSDRADLRDEVDKWFNRLNDQVSRGDYAGLDGHLWLPGMLPKWCGATC